MHHPPEPLPLLTAELLRRLNCTEPTDTRFRAVARLRQSLWREQHGYPCGRYVDTNGRPRRLGSRASALTGSVVTVDAMHCQKKHSSKRPQPACI